MSPERSSLTTAGPMGDAAAAADLEEALAAHVHGLEQEVTRYGAHARDLVEALRTSLDGGKRLRPAFAFWTWRAVTEAPARAVERSPHAGRATVLGVGVALELFQAAALVHDDVMDRSDTRRGRPAAHRAFAARHVADRWHGPADAFGESAAILLGDLALIASERQLAAALDGAPAEVARQVRHVFDVMRTEVTVGQYLDVLGQALPWGQDPAADEERARAVVRSKSARYSVEHPMALGAALGGGDADDVAVARRVGRRLGEAFQLRDDMLGVFGDPATTGKPAGDDLREGKHTVLVARAYAHSGETDRELLRRHLGDRALDDAGVARLREVVRRSGAVEQIEALITELATEAFAELDAAPWGASGREGLARLGRAAVDRSR